MNKISLHNIRLNVEAGILLENFVDMICPNEDIWSLYNDQERCYAEKDEEGDLSIHLVIKGKQRTCHIQNNEWELASGSNPTVLMATSDYYKTRFISHMIAVSNCVHKLALYEYEAYLGTVGPEHVGNPEDDAKKCMKLWAYEKNILVFSRGFCRHFN